ncbi:MAG: hypothetical protein J6578_08500 [Snodgrassella sp.]|uniref:hypothetical protein n=1 Tax=Snodgrassella sp. TaxID=2815304 RepID=UPI0025860AEF|nr:hypothetical protein [Snodgrassella sp.]MCO6508810.1 hypothetical protein [Snodgrassella sp.]
MEDYLKKEIPSELTILIWDSYMDEEAMKYIEAKVGKENSCEQLNFDKHECFKIKRKYEKDYRENEIILCMNEGIKSSFCCQKIVVDKSKGNFYLIDFLKKYIWRSIRINQRN